MTDFFIGLAIGAICALSINLYFWTKAEKMFESEIWTYRFKLLELMRDADKYGLDVPKLKEYEDKLIDLMDKENFEMEFVDKPE